MRTGFNADNEKIAFEERRYLEEDQKQLSLVISGIEYYFKELESLDTPLLKIWSIFAPAKNSERRALLKNFSTLLLKKLVSDWEQLHPEQGRLTEQSKAFIALENLLSLFELLNKLEMVLAVSTFFTTKIPAACFHEAIVEITKHFKNFFRQLKQFNAHSDTNAGFDALWDGASAYVGLQRLYEKKKNLIATFLHKPRLTDAELLELYEEHCSKESVKDEDSTLLIINGYIEEAEQLLQAINQSLQQGLTDRASGGLLELRGKLVNFIEELSEPQDRFTGFASGVEETRNISVIYSCRPKLDKFIKQYQQLLGLTLTVQPKAHEKGREKHIEPMRADAYEVIAQDSSYIPPAAPDFQVHLNYHCHGADELGAGTKPFLIAQINTNQQVSAFTLTASPNANAEASEQDVDPMRAADTFKVTTQDNSLIPPRLPDLQARLNYLNRGVDELGTKAEQLLIKQTNTILGYCKCLLAGVVSLVASCWKGIADRLDNNTNLSEPYSTRAKAAGKQREYQVVQTLRGAVCLAIPTQVACDPR